MSKIPNKIDDYARWLGDFSIQQGFGSIKDGILRLPSEDEFRVMNEKAIEFGVDIDALEVDADGSVLLSKQH